ncbi:MAG: peptide chain release factor N(5)-glutamine methyltransferase [Jiangellaceae bacterium]|nr:peptide chain release factor N(5)-glutamine methyltransferase [Jiangellaceae bacterium]
MLGLRAAIVTATERLRGAGVPSPRHDAEALAAHVLGIRRTDLARYETIDEHAYGALVARRAAREPLQYLTGRAAFRHIDVAVGPGVFVPRPETEVVAGAAIEAARAFTRPVVVDLYAGSGAIALSVADEVPAAAVHAVESNDVAVAWLRRNAAGSRVVVHHADVDGCLPELAGRVDVVVANPPYIPLGADVRDPEVAVYDPPVALWSGPDGLAALRVLEDTAGRLLQQAGVLVAEHGDLQGDAAPALFTDQRRWADVADHLDLAGRPRYLTARRVGASASEVVR